MFTYDELLNKIYNGKEGSLQVSWEDAGILQKILVDNGYCVLLSCGDFKDKYKVEWIYAGDVNDLDFANSDNVVFTSKDYIEMLTFNDYVEEPEQEKDEWQNKSLVTDEAVDAVRDYLFLNMKPGDKTNGYSWKLQDGRTIELVVHVHSAEDDVSSEEDAENVAHWIALTDCANEGVYCSHCHKKVYKSDYSNTMKVRSKFCPNCGFKMLPKVEAL